MNKIKSIICLMIVVCSMCFVGCGGNKLVGEWVIESVSIGTEETMNFDNFLKENDLEGKEELLSVNINSDNSVAVISGGMKEKGSWEEKDGKVLVIVDGNSIEFEFEKGNLVIKGEGRKMTLKKK